MERTSSHDINFDALMSTHVNRFIDRLKFLKQSSGDKLNSWYLDQRNELENMYKIRADAFKILFQTVVNDYFTELRTQIETIYKRLPIFDGSLMDSHLINILFEIELQKICENLENKMTKTLHQDTRDIINNGRQSLFNERNISKQPSTTINGERDLEKRQENVQISNMPVVNKTRKSFSFVSSHSCLDS